MFFFFFSLASFFTVGCKKDSTPEKTFRSFVEASQKGDLARLQACLDSRSFEELKQEFITRHGSVENGLKRFREDTARVKPRFLRVEPIRRHQLVRIVFQSEQGEQIMLAELDRDGHWKIQLADPNQLPSGQDLPEFQPSKGN